MLLQCSWGVKIIADDIQTLQQAILTAHPPTNTKVTQYTIYTTSAMSVGSSIWRHAIYNACNDVFLPHPSTTTPPYLTSITTPTSPLLLIPTLPTTTTTPSTPIPPRYKPHPPHPNRLVQGTPHTPPHIPSPIRHPQKYTTTNKRLKLRDAYAPHQPRNYISKGTPYPTSLSNTS